MGLGTFPARKLDSHFVSAFGFDVDADDNPHGLMIDDSEGGVISLVRDADGWLSVRRVERLYRAFKAHGAVGLVSKKRGRPSARRSPEALRLDVLRVVRERYADFGPTLAQEKLREAHGLKVSVETLRKWLVAEGLWVPRAQRAQRPHPPLARRSCLGELVQIDGCDHEWFEVHPYKWFRALD